MKTARFLFTMVGCGALTLGLGYAGEPSSQPAKQDSHENHITSDRPADRVHGDKDQAKPKHPEANNSGLAPEKNSRVGPLNARAKYMPEHEVHPPGLKKAVTAANDGLMMNKMQNHHEQPAKLPVGSATVAPRPGVVHRRSATSAGIGELTPSSAKHSVATVDGTAIKPKP